MTEQFKWTDFYTDFATKLKDFRKKRDELIQKILKVYNSTGIKLPTLEKDGVVPIDIDPFTVFGLFNKQLKTENRIRILSGIKSEFNINGEIPNRFDGIPALNNLNATFYRFADERGVEDIENLWAVFDAALQYDSSGDPKDCQSFIASYNNVLNQKGILWNITMALFWIRPNFFISLDSRSRWYLLKQMPGYIKTGIADMENEPSAEKYLTLRDEIKKVLDSGECEYRSFPEFSYKAWRVSDEVNQEEAQKKSNAKFLRWFKPIITALRDLGGSAKPQEVRNKIIENENLTEDEINETRGKNNGKRFNSDVDFARSYLAEGGYIDNSVHGVWSLTEKGKTVEMTDELASQVFKNVHSKYELKRKENNALGDADVETVHFWLYAPGKGGSLWEDFYNRNVMGLDWHELGDLTTYKSKEEMAEQLKELRGEDTSYKNTVHALWQFVHELKPGDIVFAKKGRTEILGRGVVESEYAFDKTNEEEYPNIRQVKWTHKGSWQIDEMFAMKTLTDVTNYPDFVEKISGLFDEGVEDEEEDEKIVERHPYTEEEFLEEVYIDKRSYERLIHLLETKKNIIIQGAPGVGKTFLAKRLAYSIMEEKDVNRVMMVQFHQSYTYEDFIMGYRPSASGFELKKGVFYNFCKRAEVDSENDYFFIIDEINRGNLSKIFGELFMLIENDKRGSKNKLQLLYSDEMFSVPENLHIIGLMNTADRSLAMFDYALRRRFAYFELKPGFSTEGFKAYRLGLNNEKFDKLILCVESLNEKIAADESLGDGFCIGHSYFCNIKPDKMNDEKLFEIVEYELIPLLKEYWFDAPHRVKEWSDILRRAIK